MDTGQRNSLVSRYPRVSGTIASKDAPQQSAIDVDLDEEVPRMLESVNPLAPRSLVQYSFATGAFELAPVAPATVLIMHLESSAVPKFSDEALNDPDDNFCSLLTLRPSLGKLNDGAVLADVAGPDTTEEGEQEEEEEETNQEAGGGDDDDDEVRSTVVQSSAEPPRRKKKIPNAFNFCETGAQTTWSTYEYKDSQTAPLARALFEEKVTPAKIYDAYQADFEKIQIEKALAANEPPAPVQAEIPVKEISVGDLTDRVINQNIYDEISFDFGYFEDNADEFRSTGSLLPLWRFYKHGLSVNKMDWNTIYKDQLAVAFGVPDFDLVDEAGCVILYTLKNPSHPVYERKTWTGAHSLSFNNSLPHLLAVGFYDGHVAVYNTSSEDENPMYKSSYREAHTRGVSGIVWTSRDDLGNESFLSVAYDGYVKRWVVKKSGLEGTSAMIVSLGKGITGPGGMVVAVHGSGYSIQLDPLREKEYFVGICTGDIAKYNILHGESILKVAAHDLPVRRIAHNAYVPRIFLSCSEDWSVKLWEDGRADPLMTFDLGHPVKDIAWSPYTSTVFAALSTDGFINIFDLHVDRQRPICRQGVVSSLRERAPTRFVFNKKFPVVTVGDSKGSVLMLKLSPNLRVPAKPSKKEYIEPWELEVRKLEKVLSYSKPLSVMLRTDCQINQV